MRPVPSPTKSPARRRFRKRRKEDSKPVFPLSGNWRTRADTDVMGHDPSKRQAEMNRQHPICDACGQPVLMRSELPPLSPIKQRILETVKRRPGITAQQLRDWVWVDDPNGGPLTGTKNLHVHIDQLNALLRPLDLCVRNKGGGYQIIRNVG